MTRIREVATSGDPRIDGLVDGYAWWVDTLRYGDPQRGSDYGFRYDADENHNGIPAHREWFAPLNPDQLRAVRSALDIDHRGAVPARAGFAVEGFTLQDFRDASRPAGATLRFANTGDADTAYAASPGGPNGGGDVWFGNAGWFPEIGSLHFAAILHEIGHALGLKHPHERGPFGMLPLEADSTEFTVMTYRSFVGANPDKGLTADFWSGHPQSFMMLDIAALQHLYGANFEVNSGNTIYSWSPRRGETLVDGAVALAVPANRIFATIWDGGGTDTYDLSAYRSDLQLDLGPGHASTFSNGQRADLHAGRIGQLARGNIFNALQHEGDPRSLIENAVGGAGDDGIRGNFAENLLRGGDGDDTLRGLQGRDRICGGQGADTFLFRALADSRRGEHDTLVAGDGARAFHAAGAAAGDRIDLGAIDADAGAAGDQAFAFRGGRGAGHLWVEDRGRVSWVCGNTDRDASVEFELAIRDGAACAADYTRADFVL